MRIALLVAGEDARIVSSTGWGWGGGGYGMVWDMVRCVVCGVVMKPRRPRRASSHRMLHNEVRTSRVPALGAPAYPEVGSYVTSEQ